MPTNPTDRMPANGPTAEKPPSRFRQTLVRVLIVQVVALAVLGVIQLVYNVPVGG